MTSGDGRQDAGLWRDLSALRHYLWIPIVTIGLGVAAALVFGAIAGSEQEARFRTNVIVNALPPLFGPPVLPGPFDYAALATTDDIVSQAATQHGLTDDELRPRLVAEPRVNSPEIDFTVTGENALAIAQTWNRIFAEAASSQTPRIEEGLTQPYLIQRDQSAAKLTAATAAAASDPLDELLQADLAAAQENYETASRLVQSYEVVANTMAAQSFTVKAPHEYGGGLGSTPARIAAGAVIGLIAGVLLVLVLDALDRRRRRAEHLDEAPPSLRRVEQRSGSSR